LPKWTVRSRSGEVGFSEADLPDRLLRVVSGRPAPLLLVVGTLYKDSAVSGANGGDLVANVGRRNVRSYSVPRIDLAIRIRDAA